MSVNTTLRKYQKNFKEYIAQLEKDKENLYESFPYDAITYRLFLDRGITNKSTKLYISILTDIKELEFKIDYLKKIKDDQIVMSDSDLKKLKKEFKFKIKEISSCYEDLPDILTVLQNVNYSFKPLFYAGRESEVSQHKNLSCENHEGLEQMNYDEFMSLMKHDKAYSFDDNRILKIKLKELESGITYIILQNKKISSYFSFGDIKEISYLRNDDEVLYFQRI